MKKYMKNAPKISKNENFENRISFSFKLIKSEPGARIPWSYAIWWLMTSWTKLIMVKISIRKKNTRKMPLESVQMKNSKIGLRHDPTCLKWRLEPKFHDARTSGGFRQTDRQNLVLLIHLLYAALILVMYNGREYRFVWYFGPSCSSLENMCILNIIQSSSLKH